MSLARPTDVFSGTTVVFAPHMDDCVLGCGGTLARLADRSAVHMVYVTDGRRAPAPELPWCDRVSADLAEIRASEAGLAMAFLGLPSGNVHFLGLPDGRLRGCMPRLRRAMTAVVEELRPEVVIAPFRFDRHPDHLAVHEVAASLPVPRNFEYFVYYRWRLLPGGDLRRYLSPEDVLNVEIEEVAETKRAALALFRSQTTRLYAWQSRPVLSPALLDEFSRGPETFLRWEPGRRGAAVFTGTRTWIRIAHWLEPLLKERKDRALALWRRSG